MTRRHFVRTSAAASALPFAAPHLWLRPPAEPSFTTLWEAGQLGYESFRIPGVVALPSGTLVAWCEARRQQGDWADIDVHVRRSTDGGATWTPSEALVVVGRDHPDAGANAAATDAGSESRQTANNPVMIAGRDGTLHVLYCIEYARVFYRRSDDDGRTFSAPVEITAAVEPLRAGGVYPWVVVATGPGHGIELTNGRLVVPVWLSTGEGENGHRPSAVTTVVSDDGGATWAAGELAFEHGRVYTGGPAGAQAVVNPSETVALQLADGRVLLNARTESWEMRRALSVSPNGATGWTAPVFDAELFDPTCHAALVRLTERPTFERDRVLFANPDSRARPLPGYQPVGLRGRRENLTVRLSYDECQTWAVGKVLDPGGAAYSDLAVGPDHDALCFYEKGGVAGDPSRRASLVVARFGLDWLTDGRDRIA